MMSGMEESRERAGQRAALCTPPPSSPQSDRARAKKWSLKCLLPQFNVNLSCPKLMVRNSLWTTLPNWRNEKQINFTACLHLPLCSLLNELKAKYYLQEQIVFYFQCSISTFYVLHKVEKCIWNLYAIKIKWSYIKFIVNRNKWIRN